MYYFPVFRPISANGKLQMNRRSDFDFSAPKINLDVELHDIAIEFNKSQVIILNENLSDELQFDKRAKILNVFH